MIRVQRNRLSSMGRAGLRSYQKSLVGTPPQDPAIKREWHRFTRDKALKWLILSELEQQSDYKCVYCENEDASTIDHFYPKSHYPRKTFDWQNLNLACFRCNMAKNDHFPLSGQHPVILNPMTESPEPYLFVDLSTGMIAPAAGLTPYRQRRAEDTITYFKLERTSLCKARLQVARRVERVLQAYKAVPCVETEEAVLSIISKADPFRLVVRQMLSTPDPGLVTAVAAALDNDRIQTYAQAQNLISWK